MAHQESSARDLPDRIDGVVNPAPIICSRVTTIALDSSLQPVIDIYVNNGTAEQYGAVLFTTIPASRPRLLAKSKTRTLQVWPTTCTLPETKINGCYILKTSQPGSKDQDWMSQLEYRNNNASAQMVDTRAFLDILAHERSLGDQYESISAEAGAGYKQQLKIKQWPTNFGRSIINHAETINSNEFLNGIYLTVSCAGAAIPMQRNMADLINIVYNHRGSPVLWIVVPPSESQKLEKMIQKLFKEDVKEPCCAQFVKHLKIWITAELLQKWGIGYIQVKLEALQMLVLFPSSYYWCMSTGFSIIESRLSGSQQWNVESYRFCKATSALCTLDGAGKFFEISQADVDVILELDASGVKRKRPSAIKGEMEEPNKVKDETGGVEAGSRDPGSEGEPALSLEDNDVTKADVAENSEPGPLAVDPLVLVAENDRLRQQLEDMTRKYLAADQMHREAEAKLDSANRRLVTVNQACDLEARNASMFHTYARETRAMSRQVQRENQELKARLRRLTAH